MASHPAQTFPVTPAQFDLLSQRASAAGIALSGTSGSATKDGITLAWTYNAAAQTLMIQCTDAPSFVPSSMIASRIQSLVTSSLA
jgi:hypothetical protein